MNDAQRKIDHLFASAIFDSEDTSRLQEHPEALDEYLKRSRDLQHHMKTLGIFVALVERPEVGVEELGASIKEADDGFGFEMNLVRLVDGESTYRLRITDEPTTEHPDTDECYERISVARNRRRAQAILDRLNSSATVGK